VRWLAAALLATAACSASPTPLPEVTRATDWVDPRIGTGGLGYAYGSCFVGAAAPHGFAKPGPDTDGAFGTVDFQHYSGYYADDNRVQAFTSVHLHGTGATDYGVLAVMPTLAFDPTKTTAIDYEADLVKSTEQASPGYYSVQLGDGTLVELSATPRVAVERYTLPSAGTLVIDLAKTLSGGKVDAATINVDDAAQEITGQLHHLGAMSAGYGGYTIYFVIHADIAWTAHQLWSDANPIGNGASAMGTGVGAALSVPAGATTLAIGMSLVSLDGARANLAAEVQTIDFDAIRAATSDLWEQTLGVVKLTGGSEAQRRTFYTSFYHAFLMPSVIDDDDGTYQLIGQMPTQAVGYHQMSDLSLWDTYRTVAPLYAWLAPDSAHDQARSLVGLGTGLGAYPKWPLAIGETGTMLGASAEIVLADATMRGVADAGGSDAWPMLSEAALDANAPASIRGGRDQVVSYMMDGYVPSTAYRSVSTTTEYAHDDFALANLAGALGDTADQATLQTRMHGWQQLFDPTIDFLRAKSATGTFSTTEFDEFAFGGPDGEYAEADAWQGLWAVGAPDPDGLANVLGGSDMAVATLSNMFASTKTDQETADPSEANFPRKWYWAGNEPDINAVFELADWGRPDLEQQWSRWAEDTYYTDQPDGVPGNDDGGAMGAWYVLATLGIYPVPGSDQWIVAYPRFPKARIDVGGHELVIDAAGDGPYTKAILDGVEVTSPRISHAQLAAASTLHFE
jgi:predicted alpha-1,2-mannosidase